DLYADVAEEQGLALRTTVEEGITLEADPVRLRRALANLVDNAVKYTEAGGHVTLSALAGPSDVRFEVVDTGAGIDAEELAHIWERLYRGDRSRSSKGLGLGLSLVRALVEAHGGTVEVE